jgi:phosphohistidine phosphatase
MPTLFVLRHAKSSWNNASLADHERPLNARGERAAELLAAHIGAIAPAPALVLASTARRVRETIDPLRARLPAGTEVLVEADLYGAAAPDLVARLRRVPEATPSVLVVGHNPGLEDLVRGVGTAGDPELVDRVRAKFPTGAFATLTFGGPWKDFGSEAARLEGFVVPGDLESGDLESGDLESGGPE